jgi:Protein of unknown function (DUF2490)
MEKRRNPGIPAGLLLTGLFLLAGYLPLQAQTKTINTQYQSWFSVNSTLKVSPQWAIIADLHTRRNHFMADNNFYFARAGVQYIIDKNLSVAAGYGHFWGYPTTKDWHTIAHENRIYQQIQYSSKWKNTQILQRLRNEQRWQQKMVNDAYSGELRFTDRVRYLLSLNIPVFKNKKLPTLVLADELCLQAGKEIVYNTFDQNRFFIGIREQLRPDLSFDMGYMRVYQQKRSGFEFDRNHTFRLFFYYSPQLYKHSATTNPK